MSTLSDVITASRELSFDRFVTPTFYIGGREGLVLDITPTELKVTDISASPTVITQLDFATYPTLQELANALITDPANYQISYAASFINGEASTSLLRINACAITEPKAIFRTNFFGDSKVSKKIKMYLQMILGVSCADVEDGDLNEFVESLECQRPDHMACWVAYWLVDERRLYEMAGEVLGQSTFSFSGDSGLLGVSEEGSDIDVTIGDVFRLSEPDSAKYNDGESPHKIGADNVLGDAKSFWYKLQLWLRDKIEQLYGDFSLRKDTVMMGEMDLVKDRNFYAFYDSYPYTISPLSREIMSSFESY